MTNIQKMIDSLPADVRAKAVAFAESKNQSLEEVIQNALKKEVSEAQLDAVSGGRSIVEEDGGGITEIEYEINPDGSQDIGVELGEQGIQ